MADVAYNCMAWYSTPNLFNGILGLDLKGLELPSQSEYLAHYMACSGRSQGIEPFHLVFSLFRFAVILEGIAARARSGNAAAANATQIGAQAAEFAHTARELMTRTTSCSRSGLRIVTSDDA